VSAPPSTVTTVKLHRLWLRVWTDVAVAALAAVVAAGLALERAGLWTPGDAVILVLIVVTAVLAIVTAVLEAAATVRRKREAASRELYEDLLSGTLWAVVDATGADPRDLALAAYRVDRPVLGSAKLSRVHRVRARRRPVASGVRWAPGKGVIGECVSTGAVVARDVSLSDADSDTQGLSPREFEAVRGKYGVVVAVPLVDDGGESSAVTGCLALDAPVGTLARFTTPEVLAVLEASSRALQRLTGGTPPATGLSTSGASPLRVALERQDSADEVLAVVR